MEKTTTSKAIVIIPVCVLGSMLTYYLNIIIGSGPFVASGLVGIVASLIAPQYAPSIYSASFAAMSSSAVIPTILHSVIAGLIVGIVFIICRKVFVGFGGKLGAIAFFSVLFIYLVARPKIEAKVTFDFIEGLAMVFSCILGSITTYFLSLRIRLGSVLASSIVTLVGGIAFPFIFSSAYEELTSYLVCGSYAGMSSKEIIPTSSGIGLAAAVAGIILVLEPTIFYGIGGKLGVAAFIGVFCIWVAKNAYRRFKDIVR